MEHTPWHARKKRRPGATKKDDQPGRSPALAAMAAFGGVPSDPALAQESTNCGGGLVVHLTEAIEEIPGSLRHVAEEPSEFFTHSHDYVGSPTRLASGKSSADRGRHRAPRVHHRALEFPRDFAMAPVDVASFELLRPQAPAPFAHATVENHIPALVRVYMLEIQVSFGLGSRDDEEQVCHGRLRQIQPLACSRPVVHFKNESLGARCNDLGPRTRRGKLSGQRRTCWAGTTRRPARTNLLDLVNGSPALVPRRGRASGSGFGSQPAHEPSVRRGSQHVSDLSAIVLDQAHAGDHYVVNESVRARPRHDVVEPDIRTVFGLNHDTNERDTPARAHLFTDKATGRRSIPWQLASDAAEVSPQEAITEEPDELIAFHAERAPFGLEHAARRARDIEQESRELTDLMLR